MKKFTVSFTLAIVVLLANAQNWVQVAAFPGDYGNDMEQLAFPLEPKGI